MKESLKIFNDLDWRQAIVNAALEYERLRKERRKVLEAALEASVRGDYREGDSIRTQSRSLFPVVRQAERVLAEAIDACPDISVGFVRVKNIIYVARGTARIERIDLNTILDLTPLTEDKKHANKNTSG